MYTAHCQKNCPGCGMIFSPDPSACPLEVFEGWRPDVEFADDPAGWAMLQARRQAAKNDPGVKPGMYIIDGRASGFIPPGTHECAADWDPESLYGDEWDELCEIDSHGRLVVEGQGNAISIARELFDSFSPPTLRAGEKYLIRYDVFTSDGDLVLRLERILQQEEE